MQPIRHVVRAQPLAKANLAALVALGITIPGCSSDDPADSPPDDPDEAEDTGETFDASEGTSEGPIPEDHEVTFEFVAEGLEHPWGIAFLPGGDALVTERPGRLNRLDADTGDVTEIGGAPDVYAHHQGGLLDVALHPEFEQNRWVYVTYAGAGDGGAATHLGRGVLDDDALEDFEVLHIAEPFLSGGRHFGSRMVFDDEGYVYYTTGDRGQRDRSQDRSNAIGATLRLEDDGSIPDDNPFVGEEGIEPAIYTYGHRNVQGMAVEPATGQIWQNEHGPSGGDEINRPLAGGENYGWPIATYGVEYRGGDPIGDEPHEVDETVNPVYHWEAGDSYAPSGMAFYAGDVFPAWEGDMFMGSLAKRYLSHVSVNGDSIQERRLFAEEGWRVRAVEVGPDGYIYLLVDSGSAPVVRIVPADE